MAALIVLVLLIGIPLALLRRSTYCLNISLGWDVLLSAYTGGKPGETLSGRAGSAYLQHKFRGYVFVPLIDAIMRKKGHCIAAVQGDIQRAQAAIADQSR